MSDLSVGASDRTRGKHALLNKIVGREIGVLASRSSTVRFIYPRYTMIDLCAGDGSPTAHSDLSSPKILTHHGLTAKSKGLECELVLVERNENTFSLLEQQDWIDRTFTTLHNIDCREEFPGLELHRKQAVFVHADPNHVKDWPISQRLLNQLPPYSTFLITLGCNVGGLKRLSPEERTTWFEQVEQYLSFLPSFHDAALISLLGDASQWAYLVSGPSCWRKNYEGDVQKAFKYWTSGFEMAWLRQDEPTFRQIERRLFLRRAELVNNVA